jgi:hypothetical protein
MSMRTVPPPVGIRWRDTAAGNRGNQSGEKSNFRDATQHVHSHLLGGIIATRSVNVRPGVLLTGLFSV